MLLEAFTEEFTGMEEVCLAIRSTGLKEELTTLHNPKHARIIKLDRIPAPGTLTHAQLIQSVLNITMNLASLKFTIGQSFESYFMIWFS